MMAAQMKVLLWLWGQKEQAGIECMIPFYTIMQVCNKKPKMRSRNMNKVLTNYFICVKVLRKVYGCML